MTDAINTLDTIAALCRANEQRLTDIERDLGQLLKLFRDQPHTRLSSGDYDSLRAEIKTWFAERIALNAAYAEVSGVAFNQRFNKRMRRFGTTDTVMKRLQDDTTLVRIHTHEGRTIIAEGAYYYALSSGEQAAIALSAKERKRLAAMQLTMADGGAQKSALTSKQVLDKAVERRQNQLITSGLDSVSAFEQAYSEVHFEQTNPVKESQNG